MNATLEPARLTTQTILCVQPQEASPDVLVSRAQDGCRESFELLVAYYERRVFNYLRQFVGNTHDAEDLTQDTFVKVYKNLHRFDSKYAFTTWLFTIAKRTALNFFRGSKTTQELEDNLEAKDPSPAEKVAQKDSSETFWELTRCLKPKAREALWLRYGEGLSMAEIATVMNLTEVFVRVTLHRARNQLAKRLENQSDMF